MGHISRLNRRPVELPKKSQDPIRDSKENKKQTIHKSLEFKTNKEIRSSHTLERKESKAFLELQNLDLEDLYYAEKKLFSTESFQSGGNKDVCYYPFGLSWHDNSNELQSLEDSFKTLISDIKDNLTLSDQEKKRAIKQLKRKLYVKKCRIEQPTLKTFVTISNQNFEPIEKSNIPKEVMHLFPQPITIGVYVDIVPNLGLDLFIFLNKLEKHLYQSITEQTIKQLNLPTKLQDSILRKEYSSIFFYVLYNPTLQLEALHQLDFVHRDIKPKNITVGTPNHESSLIDLESINNIENSDFVGTLNYLHPSLDVIQNNNAYKINSLNKLNQIAIKLKKQIESDLKNQSYYLKVFNPADYIIKFIKNCFCNNNRTIYFYLHHVENQIKRLESYFNENNDNYLINSKNVFNQMLNQFNSIKYYFNLPSSPDPIQRKQYDLYAFGKTVMELGLMCLRGQLCEFSIQLSKKEKPQLIKECVSLEKSLNKNFFSHEKIKLFLKNMAKLFPTNKIIPILLDINKNYLIPKIVKEFTESSCGMTRLKHRLEGIKPKKK